MKFLIAWLNLRKISTFLEPIFNYDHFVFVLNRVWISKSNSGSYEQKFIKNLKKQLVWLLGLGFL